MRKESVLGDAIQNVLGTHALSGDVLSHQTATKEMSRWEKSKKERFKKKKLSHAFGF